MHSGPENLIFGGWPLGGWHWTGVSEPDAMAAVRTAVDRGITWFDTAPVYGFGLGEIRLGRVLAPVRDHVRIMTKFGLRWDHAGTPFFETIWQGRRISVIRDLSPASIREECEASLRRLAVERIDLYQLHWDDGVTPPADIVETLSALQREGKIAAWGVCNLNTGRLHAFLKTGVLPESLQFQYNLLNRKPERSVIPFCRKYGIRFLAYSPLARGLLTGRAVLDRDWDPSDDRRFWRASRVDDVNRKLALLGDMARRHGVTIPALVLAWTLRQAGVSGVIAGARTPDQARENAAAVSLSLAEEELAGISGLF